MMCPSDAMPLSKKQRFEILKRDGFTCHYCGNSPPQVVLEVDHIIPKSKGGCDDPVNLLTACRDCNNGKSNHSLDDQPKPQRVNLEVERERLEQAKEYNDFLTEKNNLTNQWFRAVSDHWVELDGEDSDKLVICGKRASSVRLFLKYLPVFEITDAIDIAHHKFAGSEYQLIKYFCGVCWRKIKGPKTEGNE